MKNFLPNSIRKDKPSFSQEDEPQETETEIREGEQALIESEERFKTLTEIMSEIVYIIDKEGKFIFLSNSIEQLGYKPEELIGKHFRKLIHPQDLPTSYTAVLGMYRGRKTGDDKAPGLFDERRGPHRKTPFSQLRLVRKYGESEGMYRIRACGLYDKNAKGRPVRYRGALGVIMVM